MYLFLIIHQQFDVRARDQGRPEKFATARITLSIIRDNGPPNMQREYFAEVPETEPVNHIIPFYSIRATDNPRVRIRKLGEVIWLPKGGDGISMLQHFVWQLY